MEPRVKLTDIAARVGVGKSTVHRALTHDRRCRPDTAELIRAAAKEMGYRPDPIFSTMGVRRGRLSAGGVLIALLVHRPGRTSKIGRNFLLPLRENANRLGYRIEEFNLADYEEKPERLWSILYARGCAGVLVSHARRLQGQMLELNDRFPVVCIGRGDPLPYNTVRPAILAAIHLAWERMHALGYRRIGAVIYRHEPLAEDDYSRLAGCLASPIVFSEGSVPLPPYTEVHQNQSGLGKWMEKQRPDAILAFGSVTYFALTEAGFKIPKDVGFATLHWDSMPETDPLRKQFAGISQNSPEVARSALNLLDQMIRHGEHGPAALPLNLLVPPSWNDGPSLPPRTSVASPKARLASSRQRPGKLRVGVAPSGGPNSLQGIG